MPLIRYRAGYFVDNRNRVANPRQTQWKGPRPRLETDPCSTDLVITATGLRSGPVRRKCFLLGRCTAVSKHYCSGYTLKPFRQDTSGHSYARHRIYRQPVLETKNGVAELGIRSPLNPFEVLAPEAVAMISRPQSVRASPGKAVRSGLVPRGDW